MLDIMYARQAAGDDAGVLEVAAKIAQMQILLSMTFALRWSKAMDKRQIPAG